MFGSRFKSVASKAFGHLGGAVRKFGAIGNAAVKTAGHVANAAHHAYHSIDKITGGALDETLRSVPVVGTALTAGGNALRFYNRVIDPRREALAQAVDKFGHHLSDIKI